MAMSLQTHRQPMSVSHVTVWRRRATTDTSQVFWIPCGNSDQKGFKANVNTATNLHQQSVENFVWMCSSDLATVKLV
jgi:hypothetical protein